MIVPVVETFISLEGEAVWSNHPTAYVRFGGCNLKCPHFNNHNKITTEDGYAPLNFVPSDYSDLMDLPLIEMGCDSQYAVNPAFKHMWRNMTIDGLVEEVINLLPHHSWVNPNTGLPIIFSLTGGEPMLRWKSFSEIMNHPRMADCKHILIETNCTVPVNPKLIVSISEWLAADSTRRWTWSNSPKLSGSGEKWDDAIKPTVAVQQYALVQQYPHQVDQYFKFVCDHDEDQYSEVTKAMDLYYNAGIPKGTQVWVMPAACTDEQQNAITRSVASECIRRGWCFAFRNQNQIWGNGVGT